MSCVGNELKVKNKLQFMCHFKAQYKLRMTTTHKNVL